MSKNWVYYGVFFDKNVQKELLEFAKNYIAIPDGWKVFCHHMTIVFNDKSEEKQEMAEKLDEYLGTKQSITIDGIGVSNRAIALSVKDYVTQNERSHITIATAPDAKPVESNNISNWYKIDEDFSVVGTLDVFRPLTIIKNKNN